MDPGFRGCQEIRRYPADLSFRRSRESGNPGVSVTCPGPPLSRGRRLERATDLITASFAGKAGKGEKWLRSRKTDTPTSSQAPAPGQRATSSRISRLCLFGETQCLTDE